MGGLTRSAVRDTMLQLAGRLRPARFGFAPSLTADEIARASRACDLVTFDVFDTVVVRPLRAPDHAFHFLAGIEPRRARLSAEQSARQKASAQGRHEVTLAEIHEEAAREDAKWNPVEQARTEVELESRLCRLHSPAVSLLSDLRAEGIRVGFVSDTYLPAAVVRELLGDLVGDAPLIVSSEFGTTKRSGELFDLARRELGTDDQQWMHIGDTLIPDVIQPLRRGVRVGYVPRPIDQLRRHHPTIERVLANDSFRSASIVAGVLANELASLDPEARRDLDSDLGPALAEALRMASIGSGSNGSPSEWVTRVAAATRVLATDFGLEEDLEQLRGELAMMLDP